MRSARGANGGRLPADVEAQEIDELQRAAWSEATVAVVWDLSDDITLLAPNLGWVQSVTTGRLWHILRCSTTSLERRAHSLKSFFADSRAARREHSDQDVRGRGTNRLAM